MMVMGSSTLESSDNVKVIIRIRPLTVEEYNSGYKVITCTDVDCGVVSVYNPKNLRQEPKSFRFDMTFDMMSTQLSIFQKVALPVVNNALKGFNGTILVYGQTGTGKTWTMEGDPNNSELCGRGIIPNVFTRIFDVISQAKHGVKYKIDVNFIEIYNEELRDLLTENEYRKKLILKDNFEGGTYIEDLVGFHVTTIEELHRVFVEGKKNRATGSTKMNGCSSRSHAVFTIFIEREETDTCGAQHFYNSKLHLVDLAGYERQTKSQNGGTRFKESTKINQSLTTLGLVLSALSEGKKKHVPFRDSKLTRLLQDSLGGNSETVMIATVGPADYNYKETIWTLGYATRAKNVTYNATINECIRMPKFESLKKEVTDLRFQLAEMSKHDIDINDADCVQVNDGKEKKYRSIGILDFENLKDKLTNRLDDQIEYYTSDEGVKKRFQNAQLLERRRTRRMFFGISQGIVEKDLYFQKILNEYFRDREADLLKSRTFLLDMQNRIMMDFTHAKVLSKNEFKTLTIEMNQVLENVEMMLKKNQLQREVVFTYNSSAEVQGITDIFNFRKQNFLREDNTLSGMAGSDNLSTKLSDCVNWQQLGRNRSYSSIELGPRNHSVLGCPSELKLDLQEICSPDDDSDSDCHRTGFEDSGIVAECSFPSSSSDNLNDSTSASAIDSDMTTPSDSDISTDNDSTSRSCKTKVRGKIFHHPSMNLRSEFKPPNVSSPRASERKHLSNESNLKDCINPVPSLSSLNPVKPYREQIKEVCNDKGYTIVRYRHTKVITYESSDEDKEIGEGRDGVMVCNY